MRYWQYWLIGKSFTEYSDHKPLEKLIQNLEQMKNWGELVYYLSQYDFEITYSLERKNQRQIA